MNKASLFFLVSLNLFALYHCRDSPLTIEDEEEAILPTNNLHPMRNGGFMCITKWFCRKNCYCCDHKYGTTSFHCFRTVKACRKFCGKDIPGGLSYGSPGYPSKHGSLPQTGQSTGTTGMGLGGGVGSSGSGVGFDEGTSGVGLGSSNGGTQPGGFAGGSGFGSTGGTQSGGFAGGSGFGSSAGGFAGGSGFGSSSSGMEQGGFAGGSGFGSGAGGSAGGWDRLRSTRPNGFAGGSGI